MLSVCPMLALALLPRVGRGEFVDGPIPAKASESDMVGVLDAALNSGIFCKGVKGAS